MNFLDSVISTIEQCRSDQDLNEAFKQSSLLLISATINNKKIFIAGNGGSAAEAQHFSAELVGRFKRNRKAYPSIALTTDTSIISAIANDFAFDQVFSRQIEALGSENDVLILLSTSGKSKNCLLAIEAARTLKMKVISLLGRDGGDMKGLSDVEIIVKSTDTARIQEVHLMIIHAWCEIIERNIDE